MQGVAKALLQIKKCSATHRIVIDWYGGMAKDPTPYHRAARFIAEHELASDLRLHPPSKMIGLEFARASAVGLFSFFEGLPNVVCEGMACGKPILLSNVCDAGNLVRDGKNGFLCDPNSRESMANALRRLAATSDQERRQMGLESRRMAEELFGENTVMDCYERILRAAARRARIPADCTWPAMVPESAVRTAEHWANVSQGSCER
jgi:glycosyltransferase involved in cell wall biosynthesis